VLNGTILLRHMGLKLTPKERQLLEDLLHRSEERRLARAPRPSSTPPSPSVTIRPPAIGARPPAEANVKEEQSLERPTKGLSRLDLDEFVRLIDEERGLAAHFSERELQRFYVRLGASRRWRRGLMRRPAGLVARFLWALKRLIGGDPGGPMPPDPPAYA